MSLTGKRRGERGLTFIEVMVTAVILSAGLVAVYRSFFTGVDYLNHLACRLHALNMIEGRVSTSERGFQGLAAGAVAPSDLAFCAAQS